MHLSWEINHDDEIHKRTPTRFPYLDLNYSLIGYWKKVKQDDFERLQ